MQPVQLTMQPLQPQGASPPVPQRWAEALRNVQAAQRQLDDLARQLDSALYIDEEAWRQAVPQAQFTAALQVGSGSGSGSSAVLAAAAGPGGLRYACLLDLTVYSTATEPATQTHVILHVLHHPLLPDLLARMPKWGKLWERRAHAWPCADPRLSTYALQGQQRKIMELEAHLATVVARLEESERARRAAEARVSELSTEARQGAAWAPQRAAPPPAFASCSQGAPIFWTI